MDDGRWQKTAHSESTGRLPATCHLRTRPGRSGVTVFRTWRRVNWPISAYSGGKSPTDVGSVRIYYPRLSLSQQGFL